MNMYERTTSKRKWLRFPVVSSGAEFLVMGYLMRRNILTYKAPPNNEGYDLICVHPNPRHKPRHPEVAQVRVQVKSRYATDCNLAFPVKKSSFGAFDFLIIVFLNIGRFKGGNDGTTGEEQPVFYTLPTGFIRKHHDATSTWEKIKLRPLLQKIEPFKNGPGFELIAKKLGIPKPARSKGYS